MAITYIKSLIIALSDVDCVAAGVPRVAVRGPVTVLLPLLPLPLVIRY